MTLADRVSMARLREYGDLQGRIGELEGALTVLLDQARKHEHKNRWDDVASRDLLPHAMVITLTPDQYQSIRSPVGREEVQDG